MAERIGLVVAVVGVLANSFSAILGRQLNSRSQMQPIDVTIVSMGFGAFLLLALGTSWQGMPTLSISSWAIVVWLAVVNTAFAFTLWNLTLKTLSATESSILNSLMLIQIPILAFLFLGETLNQREVFGLICAGLGILVVQLRRLPMIS